ncbi:MAG: hypothetical protein ABSF98_29930 [Bryobacteraceae bacterium]|jgi:hypothetical protein
MFELRGHIDETGKKRFARSFEGLHAIPAAKATIALTRIERGPTPRAQARAFSNAGLISAPATASVLARTASALSS